MERKGNYKKKFGDHSINSVVGFAYETWNTESTNMEAVGFTNDLIQTLPLPQTPMPSAQVLQPQPQAPGNITSQGLTPTELALLSPEEQQIRLRQRGLA